MQRKVEIDSVTQRIQELKRLDAAVENAVAALRVYVLRRITRHRSDDFNFVPRQKLRQIFITAIEQNGELPVNLHLIVEGFYPLNEITKIGNHLGCAAGKIDNRDFRFGQPIDHAIDRLVGHDFFALRAGVHVAMNARQIAKLADVDLKNLRARATQID